MTDPVEERIHEFCVRMDKEDANVVMNEVITYLQGVMDTDKNPLTQADTASIILSMRLAKAIKNRTDSLKKELDEMKSQHNSLLERFIKLEKIFNAEMSRK